MNAKGGTHRTHPTPIKSFCTNEHYDEVEVDNRKVYLVGWVDEIYDEGLSVLDVDDPTRPVWLGWVGGHTPWIRGAFQVDQGRAWVGKRNGEVHLLDVSDPTHPTHAGYLQFPDTASILRADDGVLVVDFFSSGIELLRPCRAPNTRRAGGRVRPLP